MQSERRLFPRLLVNALVRLTMISSTGKAEFTAEAINLSCDGIDFNCNSEVISMLLEQPQYPPTCQLSFSMPDDQYPFTSRCRLISHRRLAQDSYRLGFKFMSCSEQNRQKLLDYLAEHAGTPIKSSPLL